MKKGKAFVLGLAFALAPIAAQAGLCPSAWQVRNDDTGALPNGGFAGGQAPTNVLTNDPAERITFLHVDIRYFNIQRTQAGPYAEIDCVYEVISPDPGGRAGGVGAVRITAEGRYASARRTRRSFNDVSRRGGIWTRTASNALLVAYRCAGVPINRCDF